MRAAADQTVIIRGQGFGNFQPFVGDVPFFMVSNLTRQWNAGNSRDAGGNYISVKVSRWTDNEIVFSGFSGAYGNLGSLVPGDQVAIYVWNVNTGYLDPVRAAAVRTTVWGDQGQAPAATAVPPPQPPPGVTAAAPTPAEGQPSTPPNSPPPAAPAGQPTPAPQQAVEPAAQSTAQSAAQLAENSPAAPAAANPSEIHSAAPETQTLSQDSQEVAFDDHTDLPPVPVNLGATQ